MKYDEESEQSLAQNPYVNIKSIEATLVALTFCLVIVSFTEKLR
ncbi:MAG: hypothetical protein QXS21_01100 [Thermoproteota archaeon]